VRAGARPDDARVAVDSLERSPRPADAGRAGRQAEFHRQPRGAARHRLQPHQHADRLAPFDHPLQPQPGGERQLPERHRRRFRRVEGDDAEVAGLQHERQRLHRLRERALVEIAAHPRVDDDVAADPEQSIEIDAGRRRRRRIEHVEHIDDRGQLAAARGGGERLQQQAGARRGSRSGQLRHLAAREPAPEPRV
jgi:hypothetical protein